MWKTIFCIFLTCSSLCAEAIPSMKALLFLYTNDEKIRTGVAEDGKLMNSLLHNIAKKLKMPITITTMQGDEADVRNVYKWIQNVPKEDIAFVYMSGHGCNSKKSWWPCFFGVDHYFIDVGEIAEYMKNKHRADFLISDCCNVIFKDNSHYLNNQSTSWASMSKANAKKLFLDFKGIVATSSSSPGQLSYTGDFGSAYTLCLLCTLQEGKFKSWESALSSSKKLCRNKTRKQLPFYIVERY